MNAKQPDKDNIYVMSLKQFCLPVLEFLVPQLYIARYWDIDVKEQINYCSDLGMLSFVN